MGAKIAQWIGRAGAYIKSMPKSHAALRYITWYAGILVFCTMLYVGAWLYHWYTHQEMPDLVELRAFLHEIASAAWIAVIGFLAESFIDRDGDGIPDQYEEKKEEQKCKE